MRSLRFVVAFSVLLSTGPALAQHNRVLLVHQGRLLDANDGPVNGGVDLSFALYAAFEVQPGQTETPLWSETRTAVPVHDGLYSVVLGEQDEVPLSEEVFTGLADRWLQVSVGEVALKPRLRIGSVPRAAVAARAEDSELLQGRSIADLDGRYVRTQDDGASSAQTGSLHLDGAVIASRFEGRFAGEPVADEFVASAQAWHAKLDTAAVAAPLTGDGTADNPLSMPKATAQVSGHLAAADFARFDAKVAPNDSRLTNARAPTAGSGHYVQNGTAEQDASFNVKGTGRTGSHLVVGGNLAIGRTQAAARLDVNGAVKVGAASTCGTGTEGSLRYNASSRQMEFCDGKSWRRMSPFLMSIAYPDSRVITYTDPSGEVRTLDLSDPSAKRESEHVVFVPGSGGSDGTLYFNLTGSSRACTILHDDDDQARPGLYFGTDAGNGHNAIWGNTSTPTFILRRQGIAGVPLYINETYRIACW